MSEIRCCALSIGRDSRASSAEAHQVARRREEDLARVRDTARDCQAAVEGRAVAARDALAYRSSNRGVLRGSPIACTDRAASPGGAHRFQALAAELGARRAYKRASRRPRAFASTAACTRAAPRADVASARAVQAISVNARDTQEDCPRRQSGARRREQPRGRDTLDEPDRLAAST
jgi:hypothetical protein